MSKLTYSRKVQLLAQYGLTEDAYLDMLEQQRNCCKICGDVMRPPHVDHDHRTGKVRGLLCTRCNTGLGFFRDEPRLLARAIVYLEENGKVY